MRPRSFNLSRRKQPEEQAELMDEPSSREDLRGSLSDLARLNRWFLGYRPTLHWLQGLHLHQLGERMHILDVGCGYGDMLRRIERWASRRGIAVELTGLDINPECVAIASQAGGSSSIRWMAGSVFDCRISPPHLVISSLFAHHLPDAELVRFLRWMEENAAVGWFINDLSRARIPSCLLGRFARAARLHPFVQHDGPLSFARAFRPEDWRRLCAAAGLATRQIEIRAWKPARLCVGRSKP